MDRDFRTGMDRTSWIAECGCFRETVHVSGLCNRLGILDTEYIAGTRLRIREDEFSFEQDDLASDPKYIFLIFFHIYHCGWVVIICRCCFVICF